MGGRETRLLVADLVAEAAIGGHFVAIPLGFFGPPFAPLGTLLGPKPKGQYSMETQGLSPEIRFGAEGHFEQSTPTPDAGPNELSCTFSGHAERMRNALHPSGTVAFGPDSSQHLTLQPSCSGYHPSLLSTSARRDSRLSRSSRIRGASCPAAAINLSTVATRPSSRRIDSFSRLSRAPLTISSH